MRESLTYLRILLIVLVATFIVACNQSDDVFENIGHTNVSLKLQIGKQANAGTRTEAGKDVLNENVIKNIDLFFYKVNASDDDQPVYVVTGLQMPDGTNVSADLDLAVPISTYKELFPTDNDTQCRIYAIVNRPAASDTDNALPDDKSIASLKDNTILYAPDFANRDEDNITHAYSPSVQSSFVMDGEAVVARNGANLSGVIPVKRVASKISLKIIGIADEVTDNNGEVWLSNKESVRLSLRRASKRTKLGSTPTEYIYTANKTNDIFRIDAVSLDVNDSESFTTSVPFYTYPTNWKNDENSRTHFILMVEWTKKTSPSVKQQTYYEVNINASGSYTQRNCYYKINQEISVLGSKEEEKPVEIYPCSYVVLDWGNAMDDADITDSEGSLNRMKYLVVDETVAEMHNVYSTQIEFFSSDPIDLVNTTINWENIAGQTSQTITFATKANATREIDAATGDIIYTFVNTQSVGGVKNRIQGNYKVIIRIHNGNPEDATDISYIYLEHRLDNGMDADSDYTEYTYTIDVAHHDNNKYSETIKIVQYPMITVVAEPNSVPNSTGGVYVNNSTSTNGNYGGVHGLTGSNKNPNRYVISVTSLNEGSKYIIGDPRNNEVDNLSTTFSSDKPTMKYPGDTNNRTLKYYHPTVETALTTDMISPRFMIASSYGVTTSISKDNARRRCATYQEDGYPAGRWRLPTQAEIEYIVSLSAMKIIPVLFGTEGTDDVAKYWSANGAVEVKAQSGTVTPSTQTGNGPVRCVYDTWYWTDKCPKTTFTWGDKATF